MTPTTETTGFEAMRHAMVASQLRTTGVDDPRLVRVMLQVPREAFVPASAQSVAYRDTMIPLDGGRAMNMPMTTARLIVEAAVDPGDKVLLIGAARGYAAAVLVGLGVELVAVECDAELAAAARSALGGAVMLVEGPLEQGCADAAPFDAIIIDGAVEQLPDALVDQLKIGGRLATGRVDNGVTRLAVGRRSEGGFGLEDFADAECVVLPGFARPRGFTF